MCCYGNYNHLSVAMVTVFSLIIPFSPLHTVTIVEEWIVLRSALCIWNKIGIMSQYDTQMHPLSAKENKGITSEYKTSAKF